MKEKRSRRRIPENQPVKEDKRLMDEAKRKEIEARLYQLLAQHDQTKSEAPTAQRETCGAKIIRRRKGDPDVRIL